MFKHKKLISVLYVKYKKVANLLYNFFSQKPYVTQAPIIALVVSVSLWEYKDGESMSYIINVSR